MILPSTPAHRPGPERRATRAAPLAVPGCVNVGRGSTVDEDALVEALRAGATGGAALDVTAVEQLPAASAPWEAPNTIITPHAAGGRPLGAGRLVSENPGTFSRATSPAEHRRSANAL